MKRVQCAVLLAAGQSSRFYPFTSYPHKSAITVLGKPIITHTIDSIVATGIDHIVVVVQPDSALPTMLGDGRERGVTIEYVVQVKPEGMGAALLCAAGLLPDAFFLLHAAHLDFSEYAAAMQARSGEGGDAVLLLRAIDDPNRSGVPEISGDRVTNVVEKPDALQPGPGFGIVGIYLLNKRYLDVLASAAADHYSFEAALAEYAGQSATYYITTEEPTPSLKYPWDVLDVKDYLLRRMSPTIAHSASIAPSAQLIGAVHVGENVRIFENAIVKGPAYIGPGAVIGNATLLRNGTSVEAGCMIGYGMEIKNSIVMTESTTHSGFIGDSVIGSHCQLGAGLCTTNVRLDRAEIKVRVNGKQERLSTGRRHLGAVLGDRVKVGSNVTIMPGTVVGSDSIIGPSSTIFHNVPQHSKFWTKFEEVWQELE